jgi:hypothetical protein
MEKIEKVTKILAGGALGVLILIGICILSIIPKLGGYLILIFLIGLFPIAIKLLLGLGRKLLYKSEKKRSKLQKSIKNELLVKSYFDNNELYTKTRNLFSTLMKTKKLSRAEVVQFEKMIDADLGCILDNYKKLEKEKTVKFKNDCHRIYFKLKSPYLSSVNFNELFAYLSEIQSK